MPRTPHIAHQTLPATSANTTFATSTMLKIIRETCPELGKPSGNMYVCCWEMQHCSAKKWKSRALSLFPHNENERSLDWAARQKGIPLSWPQHTSSAAHKIPPPLANPVDKPSGISLVCNWQSHNYPQAKDDKINQAPRPHTQHLRFLVAATLPTHNSRHLNWLQPTWTVKRSDFVLNMVFELVKKKVANSCLYPQVGL